MKQPHSLIALTVTLFVSSPVFAQDFNKRTHLAPDVRVKVNKHLAKRFVQPGLVKQRHGQNHNNGIPAPWGESSGGANQTLVDLGYTRQAPREIIIVADDIINYCLACR